MAFYNKVMNSEVYFHNSYSGDYSERASGFIGVASSLEGKIMKLKNGFRLIKNGGRESGKVRLRLMKRGKYKGNIILELLPHGTPFSETYILVDYKDVNFYSQYARR